MDAVKAVQLGMIAHCELMGDRMAILDPPPGMNAKQIRDWRQDTAGYDSSHAALYYPWVKVLDPQAAGSAWSRQRSHGGHLVPQRLRARVHKAPANEIVRGAVDLGLQITRGEQDLLNPSASTASAPSRAGVSGCGERVRPPRTRPGAT